MKVQVVDYGDNWISLFQQEADKLKRIFDRELIGIYHIGSTSVPQLHAKPIIDILLDTNAWVNSAYLVGGTLEKAAMIEHTMFMSLRLMTTTYYAIWHFGTI